MGTCASRDAVATSDVVPPPRTADDGRVHNGGSANHHHVSSSGSLILSLPGRRHSSGVPNGAYYDHESAKHEVEHGKHASHLIVVRDTEGHLVLGRQMEKHHHGVSLAQSAAAIFGSALRGGMPRTSSFGTLRGHSNFTVLQSEHHVDVRSLPELPPALFLAAVLNDVAFFKGIPVIQLALECAAIKAFKAEQAAAGETFGTPRSLRDGTLGDHPRTLATGSVSVGASATSGLQQQAAAGIAASAARSIILSCPPVTSTVPAPADVTLPDPIVASTLAPPPISVAHANRRTSISSGNRSSSTSMSVRLPAATALLAGGAAVVGGGSPRPGLGNASDRIAECKGLSVSELCHAADRHGDTILMLAAAAGSADVLELFLSVRGASIKQVKDTSKNSLLHYACTGPAHVADLYKAVRSHVLHNVELLSEVIAHHVPAPAPSPAVLPGLDGEGPAADKGEQHSPVCDGASASGVTPGVGLSLSRVGSAASLPHASSAGGGGSDKDSRDGEREGGGTPGRRSGDGVRSGANTPTGQIGTGVGGSMLRHSVSVNLLSSHGVQSKEAAAAHAQAIQQQLMLQSSASLAHQHATHAHALAAHGGHGHGSIHRASNGSAHSEREEGRRESGSFSSGATTVPGSACALPVGGGNSAASLAVHGPVPGTEIASIIPGLPSYPHAEPPWAGGGAAASALGHHRHGSSQSVGVGVGPTPGPACGSPLSTLLGSSSPIPCAGAGAGAEGPLDHCSGTAAPPPTPLPSVSVGIAMHGVPHSVPILGRTSSAFSVTQAQATPSLPSVTEGAGMGGHPPLPHVPAHTGAGPLQSATPSPALMHMHHGHHVGGGHGGAHTHGHAHSTPSDPLFIAGFSYLKAMMSYTERFEDGTDGTQGSGSDSPGGANTGTGTPRGSPVSEQSVGLELGGHSGEQASLHANPMHAHAHSMRSVSSIVAGAGTGSAFHHQSYASERGRMGLGGSLIMRRPGENGMAGGDSPSTALSHAGGSLVMRPFSQAQGQGSMGSGAGQQGGNGHGLSADNSATVSHLSTVGAGSTYGAAGADSMGVTTGGVAGLLAGAGAVGMLACGHGEGGVIPYLSPTFRIIADINAIPVRSRFPQRSIERTVEVLLSHGANPRCKNAYGRTPGDMARAHAHQVAPETTLSGVADGAILHDPPWDRILYPVAVEWALVVDHLARAKVVDPVARAGSSAASVISGTAPSVLPQGVAGVVKVVPMASASAPVSGAAAVPVVPLLVFPPSIASAAPGTGDAAQSAADAPSSVPADAAIPQVQPDIEPAQTTSCASTTVEASAGV